MDCTEQAKQIWSVVMPNHPWPKGWKVRFRKMRHYGWCSWRDKYITLAKNHDDVIKTLIHEFVHMHYQNNLKHGNEFRRVQGRWMERWFGEPTLVPWMDRMYDPKTGKLIRN